LQQMWDDHTGPLGNTAFTEAGPQVS